MAPTLVSETWIQAGLGNGDGWTRRQSLRAALLAATLVTLAAAGPLAVLAVRADDGRADPVEAVVDGRPMDISGKELAADAVLVLEAKDLDGAAWALFLRDGARVAGDSSANGAPLLIDFGALVLRSGEYDLFVTGTRSDGETVQRASRFRVVDEA